ncbi:tail completion protein gp17 [Sphingomonas sp.]|uniref:tail completion protein gp17 n=1 Tax=Sphingomonas sp. TaxID=28214 RepID=UPI003B3B78DF
MMEQDLRTRLKAGQALTDRVGDRIDWGLRPAATALPAVTLTVVSAPVQYTYLGRQRLRWARIQIDVWAATYKDAATVAALLPPLIEPKETVGATDFKGAFVSMEIDADPEEAAGGTLIHRRIVEFIVWHRPAD